MSERHSVDAYSPAEIAQRVEAAGVAKAGLGARATLVLAVLAGAFIAFGAMLYVVVVTDSGLGFGPERLLGGFAFSLGLILVLVGGAELFTGNSLIVFAWADGKIAAAALLRNWRWSTSATSWAPARRQSPSTSQASTGSPAARSARRWPRSPPQVALTPLEALVRGILCNVLVCLAVWLCLSARRVTGKILAIVFPIAGFVALGFEHSVANMYIIPAGWLAGAETVTLGGYLANIAVVTVGNVIGGGVLVALTYCWFTASGSETRFPASSPALSTPPRKNPRRGCRGWESKRGYWDTTG